jgi:homoserine O-acetyltransferase
VSVSSSGKFARTSAQTIALNEVPRQAIYADPNWKEGDYYGGEPPNAGLAVARMIGHITYLSETSMREKFGRRLQEREKYGYDFATEFEVSYLSTGNRFTSRFDANSFLTSRRSTTSYPSDGDSLAFIRQAKFLVLSYSSD